MKVFATGVTGTIGKHLADGVLPISTDMRASLEVFQKLDLGFDGCVIHLAGVVGPSLVEKNFEESWKINVEGTRKLAVASLQKEVRRFVYISTSHVYKPSIQFLTEESEVEPSNTYAQQKLEAERTLQEIFFNHLEKLCIVRIFSVLDWDVQEFTLGGGIKRLALGDPNFQLRNSNDVRDFLTPKRIAQIIIEITKKNKLLGIVNLCTGKALTVREATVKMLTESNFEIAESRIHSGNSNLPYMVGDNSKLLSYLPNLGLEWSPSRFER